jgi:hypothetical protein
MIRLSKPVRLLEWGEGTNTHNQTWRTFAEGVLNNKPKWYSGLTTLKIEVNGQVEIKNEKSKAVKVMQPGEGMVHTPGRWGEVAMGNLKSMTTNDGKTVVEIEITGATKMEK